MKKVALFVFSAVLLGIPAQSEAHTYDRDDDIHPLRLVAYILHPVGEALDRWVMRPIHEFVSGPKTHEIFGHDPRERGLDYPDHLDPWGVDYGGTLINRSVSDSDTLMAPSAPEPDTGVQVETDPETGVVTFTLSERILFNYDSAELLATGVDKLSAIAGQIAADAPAGAGIVVVGHASAEGTEAYNLALSRERARTVRGALVAAGISPDRIDVEAMGETDPIADNNTEEGRRKNRRVEIRVGGE